MKTRITFLIAVLISLFSVAQNGINYKAIVKDDSGNIIAGDLIVVQFEIRQGTETGTVIYKEIHTPTTDNNGLIILNIGEETPSVGTFDSIDWGSDAHFLNVHVNTGSGLMDLGTSQFKTVPYALNALNSSDSYWDRTSTVVHNNTDDIGIGSDTLSAKLGIYSNSLYSKPHILLQENEDDYARLNFGNINGNQTNWSIAGYIGNPDDGNDDRLNFRNDRGGEIMTITGDGKVGIGVGISPKVGLHVGDNKRVLFGADTLSFGDKLMWLPDLHAFRVGTLDNGSASVYWNRDSIGLYSFASGHNTRAQGFGATAMGRDTEATDSYAMATGYFTNADGQYSTAMGYNTDAFGTGSTALGYNTDAEQNYTFAAGHTAEAQAIYSVAIGDHVQAQSYASIAVGRYNFGGGNATSWVGSSPLFEIGNGTSTSTRSNAMTVLKNGRIGIGTNFPSSELHVVGDVRIGSQETITDGGAFLLAFNASLRPSTNNERSLGNAANRWTTVYATNGTINTSDRRDKENINDLNYGLNEVMQLRPVSYTWKDKNLSNGKTKLGLIAQDVREIINEVVQDKEWIQDEGSTTKRSVDAERMGIYYSDLIPVLVKAIQEQQGTIEDLKARIQDLENR